MKTSNFILRKHTAVIRRYTESEGDKVSYVDTEISCFKTRTGYENYDWKGNFASEEKSVLHVLPDTDINPDTDMILDDDGIAEYRIVEINKCPLGTHWEVFFGKKAV